MQPFMLSNASYSPSSGSYQNALGRNNLAQQRRPDIKGMVAPNQLAGMNLNPGTNMKGLGGQDPGSPGGQQLLAMLSQVAGAQQPGATQQPGGQLGQQGGPGALQVTSGVEAGPVYNPQQQQAATGALRGASPSLPPGMGGGLAQQFQDVFRGQTSAGATGMDRQMSQANAQQQLGSQNARAQSGVNWAQVLANQYGGQLGVDSARLAMMMNFLGGLV